MLANIEEVMTRGGKMDDITERSANISPSPPPPLSLQVETADVNYFYVHVIEFRY